MALTRHNSQTIAWFWDLYKRSLIDLDPPYQRRAVWNNRYREDFIDTLLLGYPAPAIFLYEEVEPSGTIRYAVVDGKQRLLTIFDFIQNRYPVGERSIHEGLRGLYFEGLDTDRKRQLFSYEFSVEYLPTKDEKIINNVFDRINRNTAKLTQQELRHARFDGVFISAAEDLAEWLPTQLSTSFPRITESSRRQMKDVELVAQLLLLLEEGPKGYSAEQLDQAFSDRDASWELKHEVETRFRRTTDALRQITEGDGTPLRTSRFRNQADFYSLFGAVDRLLAANSLASIAHCSSRLIAFLAVLENELRRAVDTRAQSYYEAARSASNDAGPRRLRIEIMSDVLTGAWTPTPLA